MAVLDNSLRGLSRFLAIRSLLRQPQQTTLRVGYNGHERLIDFVGNRRSEFPHGSQARGMRQIRLSFAQALLGLFERGYVHDRPYEFASSRLAHDGVNNDAEVLD